MERRWRCGSKRSEPQPHGRATFAQVPPERLGRTKSSGDVLRQPHEGRLCDLNCRWCITKPGQRWIPNPFSTGISTDQGGVVGSAVPHQPAVCFLACRNSARAVSDQLRRRWLMAVPFAPYPTGTAPLARDHHELPSLDHRRFQSVRRNAANARPNWAGTKHLFNKDTPESHAILASTAGRRYWGHDAFAKGTSNGRRFRIPGPPAFTWPRQSV